MTDRRSDLATTCSKFIRAADDAPAAHGGVAPMNRTEPAKKPARSRLAFFARPTYPRSHVAGAAAQRWNALATTCPPQLLGGLGPGIFRVV
jgi:hypothetical protein